MHEQDGAAAREEGRGRERDSMRPWACVGLWLTAALVAASASQQQQWLRLDGQELADAIQQWGTSNADAVITLRPNAIYELGNATFGRRVAGARNYSTLTSTASNSSGSSSGRPFTNGTLQLNGWRTWEALSSNAAPSTVIDTGMRVGLTPLLSTATLLHQDLTFTNLCTGAIELDGVTFISVSTLTIWSFNIAAPTVVLNKVILYTPQAEVAWIAYGEIAVRLGGAHLMPVLQQYGKRLQAYAPLLLLYAYKVGPHEIFTRKAAGALGPDTKHIWRSLDKPGDPLVPVLREQGLLLPQRWCNGTRVAPEIADSPVNLQWGPLYMVETAARARAGLVNATALAPLQLAAKRPMAGVMFFLPSLELSEASLPASGQLALTAPLLLHGPLNESAPTPVLDLSARTTPLFAATTAAAQLCISLLVLRLPSLPTPSASTATQPFTSALPLSGLVLAATEGAASNTSGAPVRSGALVELHDATLVVPVLDFLALLMLATDGRPTGGVRLCMDGTTLQQAAQLQAGIRALKPTNTTWERLTLSAYTGWGANATDLTILPQTPVPASMVQRCGSLLGSDDAAATPSPPPGGSGGEDSSAPIGVIVGCSVGGAVLLALVAAAAVALWRRKKAQADSRSGVAGPLPGSKPGTGDGDGDAHALTLPAHPQDSGLSTEALTIKVASEHASGDGGGPPHSTLVDLLEKCEVNLLSSARAPDVPTGGSPSKADPGSGPEGPPSLCQAHERLMDVVKSRRQLTNEARQSTDTAAESVESGASGTHPRHEVQQVATQLQAQSADRLVLEKVLGRGGSGIVYTGRWRGLPVAIKTQVFEAWVGGDDGDGAAAAPGDAASKAQLKYVRAIMETAISASVGHRNVVATYHYDIKRMDEQMDATSGLQVSGAAASLDVTPPPVSAGIQAFKVFLVQTILQQQVIKTNPDRLVTIANLLYHVACGLEYLHGQGIIHGDLTPGNILLKVDLAQQHQIVAKLGDFGLSQRLDPHATHVSGFGAGTPFYVAPEVAKHKRTSLASDIFSFGIVAWELYSGSAPYVSTGPGEFKCNPLFPDYPFGTAPPPDTQKLIKRCLHPEPRKRPPAGELVAMFAQHLGIEPAQGPGATRAVVEDTPATIPEEPEGGLAGAEGHTEMQGRKAVMHL